MNSFAVKAVIDSLKMYGTKIGRDKNINIDIYLNSFLSDDLKISLSNIKDPK